MIFMTPKIIRRPAATTKRIAAVVVMSRNCTSMGLGLAGGGEARPVGYASPGQGLLQVRALVAGIDVLEGRDQLDPAVRRDLTEVHRQRRVALLAHLDRAARAVELHFRERLDDTVRSRAAG